MQLTPLELADVLLIAPQVDQDPRGSFMEAWNSERFARAGLMCDFVQDNLSCSRQNVLRGLHFQYPHGQRKLVQVLAGQIYDVAVDVRLGSPTFSHWVGVTLSADEPRQLFIPEGFAHGFCVLSASALVAYKCTAHYQPSCERGVAWNDPFLAIPWPTQQPFLSPKDAALPPLSMLADDQLPRHDGALVTNQVARGQRLPVFESAG